MNTLSIFLYLSDIAQNIQGTLVFFAVVTGALFILNTIRTGIFNDSTGRYMVNEGKEVKKYKILPFAVPLLLFALTASVIPSRATFLAIAASEIGETIVKTPEVSGVLTDTLALIQKKLKTELGEDKPKDTK